MDLAFLRSSIVETVDRLAKLGHDDQTAALRIKILKDVPNVPLCLNTLAFAICRENRDFANESMVPEKEAQEKRGMSVRRSLAKMKN